MKRALVRIAAAVLLLLLIPKAGFAQSADPETAVDITSDPATTEGEVGSLVAVDIYLHTTLPENLLLCSIEGVLQYDADLLSFGAVFEADEEKELRSFLKDGKATIPVYNSSDPGKLRFVVADAYGWETDGFWLMLEFRVDREGATDFVFSDLTYLCVDHETGEVYKYTAEPIKAGSLVTPNAASVTPTAEATDTPKPTEEASVTPTETVTPTVTEPPQPTEEPTEPPTEAPTEAPTEEAETRAETTAEPPASVTPQPLEEEDKSPSTFILTIAVLTGIVIVLLLGTLAVVLILVRRKKPRGDDDDIRF